MIVKTGIFASKEDIEAIYKSYSEMRATPVVRVHGTWLHEDALKLHTNRINDLAIKYGLPKPGLIDGEVNNYGMNADGEFTRYEV